MPVTSVTKEPEALTMTVVADFAVPVERLWEAYTDPRQIEKFWGPIEWPATFFRHDVTVGGRTEYEMRGPDGEASRGYWTWLAIEPRRHFEVRDGFANPDGTDNPDMPWMRVTFDFDEMPDGSRLTTVTYFNSTDELQQLVEMGMEQGLREAMSQIDDVLADLTAFAADSATEAQILSDTQVRVSRVIRGGVEEVWRAHHEPELMKQWLLGADGWEMTVCEIPAEVGGTYRYAWALAGTGDDGFGFDGEVLERHAPHREVTTERMTGTDYPPTTNEMTLTPVPGGTLLSIVITYTDSETRDTVLATGMTEGMEASYARLEDLLS